MAFVTLSGILILRLVQEATLSGIFIMRLVQELFVALLHCHILILRLVQEVGCGFVLLLES